MDQNGNVVGICTKMLYFDGIPVSSGLNLFLSMNNTLMSLNIDMVSDKEYETIKDSYYEVNGKVKEDQLKGRFIDYNGISCRFVINISSDGRSFEGKIDRAGTTVHLKGTRKQ